MATGHILPGYGNPVSRLRRAQSAYPMDSKKLRELTAKHIPDMDPRTLDHIRENARNMWLRPRYEPTTYNTFHVGDQLDEPTESLPTEPLRRHKPHPKPVFLINRLHYVPGYHNPDTTMGKPVYRVDDTFSEEERQLRRHQREKYVARPRTPAVDQYAEPWAQLTDAVGPVEAWGAQAWLKVADDDHQHEVVNAIRDYKDKELFNISRSSKVPIQGVNVEEQINVEKMNIKFNNQTNDDVIVSEHQTSKTTSDNMKAGYGNQKMLNTIAQRFASAKVSSASPVADAAPRPHTAIPSTHRWMKNAGATESEAVRRILYGGYPPSTIQPLGSLGNPPTVLQRRQQDVDNVRRGKYINKYPRGDFLIHPEYPPSFPHHRID